MFGLFGGPSAKVESDRVVPFHFFDDTPVWRSFVLYSMFVFDDVLDTGRLQKSLKEVVESPGWRKLGARLRKNGRGDLEYHMPSHFTDDRPAVFVSHVHHDQPMADHPLASQIPKATERPAVVGNPSDFDPLMLREGAPRKLDDYLNSDLPQLALHMVSFTDKTILTLNWPHTAFDALGQRALLDAWVLRLNGHDIQTPIGTESDPLATFGTNPTETHKLADKRMFTPGLGYYAMKNIANFAWRRHENRMVCVPAAFIHTLREKVLKELASNSNSNQGKSITWVSEGDVLCAWWTRIAISHLPSDSKTTVVLNNAYSLRNTLEGDLLPAGQPYLSNAIGFINVLMQAKDILQKPVSHTAAYIRECINTYGTREQMEAFGAMVRETSSKLPPFFGDPGMQMVTYSNWTKAKLYDLDFSSAISSSSSSTGKGGKLVGTPSYIQNCQFGFTLPNAFPIIGKDLQGNYWFSGYMTEGTWAKLEELLEKE